MVLFNDRVYGSTGVLFSGREAALVFLYLLCCCIVTYVQGNIIQFQRITAAWAGSRWRIS